MKHQIRKVEQTTIWSATEAIQLDPENFRNLDEEAYTGESEEDFVKYVASLDQYNLPYDLDSESMDLLTALHEAPMEEINNSAQKGENSWLEIGEKDESYRKTGGFNTIATSND
jgi:hypothetical protein